MKRTPEQKRIGALERAMEDLLELLQGHRCPYCGGGECPVTAARSILEHPDTAPIVTRRGLAGRNRRHVSPENSELPVQDESGPVRLEP